MKAENHSLVARKYLLPFILVTSLFFLWGFAHSILDVLNKHFQENLEITRTHSAMIQVKIALKTLALKQFVEKVLGHWLLGYTLYILISKVF